jgi:hypothetical protein
LESRVLCNTDKLEEEDGLKETDQGNMKGKANKAIEPGLRRCKGSGRLQWSRNSKFIYILL